MSEKMQLPKLLWEATNAVKEQSNIYSFQKYIEKEQNVTFKNYESLWQWSVQNIELFWEAIWKYYEVIHEGVYEKVLHSRKMPGAKWFEGTSLNYAEHIFRQSNETHPAIIAQTEKRPLTEISWKELKSQVASLAKWLKSQGLKKGDTVGAYMANIPEASIAFLACCSIGVIWSSCSPDFGVSSVLDRFKQIKPKILFAVDGYHYGGKTYKRTQEVKELSEALDSLENTVIVPLVHADTFDYPFTKWNECINSIHAELCFEKVPFDHPIWVLYSSGTTGIPKAITHSHGGILLEHLKYVHLQNNVQAGERFFWYSTTGWMMWNFVQATWLAGATVVLYDGSPGWPDMNVLWHLSEKVNINHFGTSAPYLVACMKKGITPKKSFDLSSLQSIGSTGAPLPPEAFDYVYESIKEDVWLCSMSGGTDVCTAFVGSTPTKPVYEGEIQCRALGVSLYAFDEMGNAVTDEVGEMVITEPMPSMPIYFWGDKDNKRYLSSYFEEYKGVWRHGDWVKIFSSGSLVILGRSDATLNRQGVRIGTAEIYRSINKIAEIKDCLIVNLELSGGRHYMPLFVMMQDGVALDESIIKKIKTQLRSDYSPRHVPDEVVLVSDIPYTISGKKLEAPVKKILLGMDVQKAANKDAMRNPESLDFFIEFHSTIMRIKS